MILIPTLVNEINETGYLIVLNNSKACYSLKRFSTNRVFPSTLINYIKLYYYKKIEKIQEKTQLNQINGSILKLCCILNDILTKSYAFLKGLY